MDTASKDSPDVPSREETVEKTQYRDFDFGADQVAYSLPIALLALFSAFKYLVFTVTIIFMTTYRVTYPQVFFIYQTGNLFFDDIIVISLASVAALTIFHSNKRLLFLVLGSILAPLGLSMTINSLVPLDIAALAAFPGIIIAYYFSRKKLNLNNRITRISVIWSAVGVLFVIELLSLLTWIIFPSYAPYWSNIYSQQPQWYLANVEAQLFYAGARLAPIMMLLMSFSFLIRPGANSLIQILFGRSIHDKEQIRNLNDEMANLNSSHSEIKSHEKGYEVSLPLAKTEPKDTQETIAAPLGRRRRLHPNLRARKSLDSANRPKRRFRVRRAEMSLTEQMVQQNTVNKGLGKVNKRFWIFLSISLVVLFSLYPYIPTLNPDFQLASVDAPYYVNQIDNIKNNGIFSKDGPFSFSNERALSVIVFYGLAAIAVNQPTTIVVAYLPIFLGGLLVFSAYFMIRYGANFTGKDELKNVFVVLLVPFSMQFIVGIYGGFFANMLALSFMLLSIPFYLRFLESRKMLDLALFTLMMLLTLFSHVYTWVFLAATLVIATTIPFAMKKGREPKRAHIYVISSLIIPVIILVMISSVISGRSGLEYLSGVAGTNFGDDFLDTRLFNINNVFRFYLGGFLANPVIIGLALIWAFKADYHNRFNVILLSSIFLFSAFFFLGDEVTQSRIIYDMPLFVPAALALANILDGTYLSKLDPRLRMLIIIVIFLYLGNYALRSLANFYLIAPSLPSPIT